MTTAATSRDRRRPALLEELATSCCRRGPCRRSGTSGSRQPCSRCTTRSGSCRRTPGTPRRRVRGPGPVGPPTSSCRVACARTPGPRRPLRGSPSTIAAAPSAPSLPVIANGEILARWQTSLASIRPRPAICCWSRRYPWMRMLVVGERLGQRLRRHVERLGAEPVERRAVEHRAVGDAPHAGAPFGAGLGQQQRRARRRTRTAPDRCAAWPTASRRPAAARLASGGRRT